MARKKAVAKPSSTQEDVERERYEKVFDTVKDVQLFVAFAILVSALSLLILLTVVMPMSDKINNINARLDTIQMAQIQQYTTMDEYANNTSPFCFGYDQYGIKGWGIDVSKIPSQCEVSQ